MLQRRGGASTMLLGLSALLLLHGCGAATTTECYASWQCAGPQCAAVMGGDSGTAGPFSSADECEQWRQTYILSSTCSCGTGAPTAPAATLSSILVTPSSPPIPLGATRQMTATGRYSDGSSEDLTTRVTWSQGTIGSITIGPGGLVTALALGSTVVSATFSGLSGSANVTVGAAALQSIAITPADPSIPLGATQAFEATGVYSNGSTVPLSSATWASSAPAVATVSTGEVGSVLATSVGLGATTITASWAGLVGSTTLTVTPVALVSVTVTPASAYAVVGLGVQLAATGTYSDGRTEDLTALASWSSSTPAVATVSAGGLAAGVAAGTSEITARFGALAGAASLYVSNATLLSIAVSPASPRMAPGGEQPFVATGTFSDGAVEPLFGVTWTSSAPSVATLDAAGTATAVALGSTTITATSGVIQGSTGLTVTLTGTRWVQRSSPVALPLAAVAWTGARFVAVGAGGTILSSFDGVGWAPHSSGTTSDLAAVTSSGSNVVAVGAAGTILTSPDGVDWTPQASGTSAALGGVTWSGAQFVAVGEDGTVLTSPDAIAWTPRAAVTFYDLSGVLWNGALFVAVGGSTGSTSAGGTVLTSTDGVSWAENRIFFSHPIGAASSATTSVLVGGSVSFNLQTHARRSSGFIASSLDAAAWTSRASGTGSFLYAVAWTGEEFVAVGQAGTILASPDGTSWLPRQSGTTEDLRGVAGSGAALVAVGSSGTILASP